MIFIIYLCFMYEHILVYAHWIEPTNELFSNTHLPSRQELRRRQQQQEPKIKRFTALNRLWKRIKTEILSI